MDEKRLAHILISSISEELVQEETDWNTVCSSLDSLKKAAEYEYRITKGGKPSGNGWERTPNSHNANSYRKKIDDTMIKTLKPSRPEYPKHPRKPQKPDILGNKNLLSSERTGSPMRNDIILATDYEYMITDGERPEGEGWERTPHPRVKNSWRRKRVPHRDRSTHEESSSRRSSRYNPSDIPESMSYVLSCLFNDDSRSRYYIDTRNDSDLKHDVRELFEKYSVGDSTKYRIEKFGTDESGRSDNARKELSYLATKVMGVRPDDYSITEKSRLFVTDEDIEDAKKFMKASQEILKMSGLVDEDGYVTLYRGTNGQLDEETGRYNGTNCESWTFNPKKAFQESQIVKAKIPLERVIGCDVGTGMYNFDENEVTCCTNDLDLKCELIPKNSDGFYSDALEKEQKDVSKQIENNVKEMYRPLLNYKKTGMSAREIDDLLLKTWSAENGMKVSGAIESTSRDLATLKEHHYWPVRLRVAGHPNTDDKTLEFLTNDKNSFVRETASDSLESRKRDEKNESSEDREDQKTKEEPEMDVSKMSLEEKMKISSDKKTSQEILDSLSEDENESIRMRVAFNKNTSAKTLENLAHDESYTVQRCVAINTSTTPEALKELSKNLKFGIRKCVASNTSATSEILDSLSNDAISSVRHDVIMNPSTSNETIEKMTNDKESSLASLASDVLKKHKMSSHELRKLSDEGDSFARGLLLAREKVRHDFCLETLGNDEKTYQQLKSYKKSIGTRRGHGRSPEQVKQNFIRNMDPSKYGSPEEFQKAKQHIQEMPTSRFDRLLEIIFNKDEDEVKEEDDEVKSLLG